MIIRDISIRDIQKEKNWRFIPPDRNDWLMRPMEEWGSIESAIQFQPGDMIVYSGLIAYSNGRVIPIVCL